MLLVIIYLAFISLGLPDTLLGTAWPVMHLALGVELSAAGVCSFIVSTGTVVSSLLTVRLVRRIGTGYVVLLSVALTAVALLLISFAPSFWALCLFSIPLGLGAGAVDAALNNYVALHYQARHMNWLHCFWGLGATAGPAVMALFLANQNGWRNGYQIIGGLQVLLVAGMIFALPLWKKAAGAREQAGETVDQGRLMSNREALRFPKVIHAMLSFFFYCGAEMVVGLWAASYLVGIRQLTADTAALYVSIYYGGITVGRLLCGFLSARFTSKTLIRLGCGLSLLGTALLFIGGTPVMCMPALVLIGLGFAPIYPSMMHETPTRFGKDASQAIIGLQMAGAYLGCTLLPPALGWMGSRLGMGIFPIVLLALLVSMAFCLEWINRYLKNRGTLSRDA